ncbi:MAG: zincin-like metallopeptidase domain-containing protein [Methylococcaceae bacterium]
MAQGKNQTPYYQQIADKLIKQLEEGTASWQKPWKPGEIRMPHNPVSGSKYRGSNALWLEMQGRGDPRWMTYKQAQSIGAQVVKGEKGTLIQYWKFTDQIPMRDKNGKVVTNADGSKKMVTIRLDRPKVFSAVVFNAGQVNGITPLEVVEPEWDRHERAETILNHSGVSIHHDQANGALYKLSTDSIHLPGREQFETADKYYATVLHELGHATGHPSRLDRGLSGAFGSETYAREELRAEIASLMIGDEVGIGHDPGQHAAYVKSWIKVLKEDPKEILRAARDAEAIMDHMVCLEKNINHESVRNAGHDKTNQQQTDEREENRLSKLAEEFATKKFSNEADRARFLEVVSERVHASQLKPRESAPEESLDLER